MVNPTGRVRSALTGLGSGASSPGERYLPDASIFAVLPTHVAVVVVGALLVL